MIDIIIPIYNINLEQLKTCLLSITAQTIADNIFITIVDDGSSIIDKNFNILLNKISYFIDIQFLSYPENKGPGYARQYGIDHTNNEYIMFVDADDMLSPIAAETLLKALDKESDKAIAVGEFYSLKNKNMNVNIIKTQLTWVFSKMYRRSIIEKYNFSFNTAKSCSYGNEDVGFNVQFQHVLTDSCLVFVHQPLYYWSDKNKNSITRKNNNEYSYTKGHKGYVMNFIYSFLKTQDKTIRKNSEKYAFKHLLDIYKDIHKYYKSIQKYGVEEDLMQYSYLYYNEVFQQFDSIYKEKLLKQYWDADKYCQEKKLKYEDFLKYLNKLRDNSLNN